MEDKPDLRKAKWGTRFRSSILQYFSCALCETKFRPGEDLRRAQDIEKPNGSSYYAHDHCVERL